jgi:mRNA-degrading endonuclease RelE of RelBE toxin-antitoxin system
MYKVIWEADAKKGLKKIDFTIARRIKAKVETYLVQDPIKLGKPLKHE